MYKDEFHRLNETVEASEALIQHTLQAAEQRAARKQLRPWQLAGAMAAALCVLVAVVFLQRPAPHDLVASSGELPTNTAAFMPLNTSSSAGSALCNVDGMAMSLLTSMTDGDRSYILFKLQGEKVDRDMELTLTLSKDSSKVSRTIYLTPAAFDVVEKSAVFMAVFDNQWYDWSIIFQQDGAVNSAYYADHSGQQLTLNAGDQVTLTIQSYARKFRDDIAWNPDWHTLKADWEDAYYTAAKWTRFYDAEPLYTICEGFEIVAAGMSSLGAHIVTRYTYDPEDARITDPVTDYNINFSFAGVGLTHNTKPYQSYEPVNTTGTHISRHTYAQRHENYCEMVIPLTATEMAIYDFEADASWEYAPDPGESWALTFSLGGSQQAALPQAADPADSIRLEAGQATIDAKGKITIPIFVRGDGIDQQSIPDLDLPYHQAFANGTGWGGANRLAPADGDDPHATVTLPLKEGYSLADLGESLTVSMTSVSIGNKYVQTLHDELKWKDIPLSGFVDHSFGAEPYIVVRPVLVTGEPIIDFGGGMAVTAIGFNAEGKLTIQTQAATVLPLNSDCHVTLFSDGDPATEEDDRWLFSTGCNAWEDKESGFYFRDDIYDVTRDELDQYVMLSFVQYIGQLIEGEWQLTVPISDIQRIQ